MQLLATICLAAVASATQLTGSRSAYFALKSVMERQVQICQSIPPPYTCERSCGPGNIECVSWPTCYNPSAGETCCSNGDYCPAGYYCTDAGCCDNSLTLEECGASVTLTTIAPPQTTATESAPAETTVATTTSDIFSFTDTNPTSTSTEAIPTFTESSSSSSSSSAHATTSSSTSTSSSTKSASSATVTAGAGKNAVIGILPAIGGLAAFWFAF
ncbi:hypothetical protein BX600DRAFT_510148 [Xylariales sp. PMI_506]|nr:hypothetical protein BX600DRAFT_510148 [Xylariales sp. PMI_506]